MSITNNFNFIGSRAQHIKLATQFEVRANNSGLTY